MFFTDLQCLYEHIVMKHYKRKVYYVYTKLLALNFSRNIDKLFFTSKNYLLIATFISNTFVFLQNFYRQKPVFIKMLVLLEITIIILHEINNTFYSTNKINEQESHSQKIESSLFVRYT